MSHHLKLRAGVFYFRSKLPADVRRIINRSELSYSLRTADPESASALALEMRARQLRLCRAVRQAGPMTSDQIDTLVSQYMETYRANRESDAVAFGELEPAFSAERQSFLRSEMQDAQEALARNRLASTERIATELMREAGVQLDSDAVRRLCHRLLFARVDVLKDEVQALPAVPPSAAPSAATVATPRVSELVKEYLLHRDASDPMRPKTRIEAVAALSTLVDLLNDPPLASVRNRDAQDYGRKLSQMPKRWRQMNRGKTASAVLGETEGKDLPRIEPATFNKELALVRSFWRWACERDELPRNAMSVIRPADVGSTKDKRRPFSDDDVRQLAPFIEGERIARPERYWILTLLAYTGARLEEIAQLRKQDVFQVDDIACLRICADAGSVKNLASERDLPIHSAVIAKGFLGFVEGVTSGRIFGDASGQPVSKWFRRQVATLAPDARAKKSLHSFRHTMRDKLRGAGVDDVTRREILGHAHGDVEDQTYGSATSMQERRDALERVRLPL